MNKFDEAAGSLEICKYAVGAEYYIDIGDPEHYETIRLALTQAAEIERGDKVVVSGWKPIDDIPEETKLHIKSMGRLEWGAVVPKPDSQHISDFKDSLDITREFFGLQGDQSLNGAYLEGTETVLCHTGISPNSPQNACIIVTLWNWLHDRITASERKDDE